MKNKINLYLQMFKIGLIGFGGGNALVPIMKKELVEKNNYIGEEEFEKAVIVANLTPGALPIELAAIIGKIVNGYHGMILSALSMALPGILISIFLFLLFINGNNFIMNGFSFASIGITTFVLFLLLNYVTNTLKKVKDNKSALKVIVLIILLTSSKNICELMGININVIVDLSSIDIIMLSLSAIIFCSDKKEYKYNKYITVSLILLYIISVSINFYYNIYISFMCRILMIILSIVKISKELKSSEKKNRKIIKKLLKEEIVWICMGVVCWLPSLILFGNNSKLIPNGFISSLISFGGGDSYLAIAEGMFIDTNIISSDIFYGQIVPVVNAVPGSILCKTLSLIGFYLGYSTELNLIDGIIMTIAGLGTSIVASGMIVTLGNYIKDHIENTDFFTKLKKWIMVIVSGLLVNIMLSLVNQNIIIVQNNNLNKLYGIVLTLFLLGISYIIKNKLKKSNIVTIIALVILSCTFFIFI